jgi:hypothetical protein
MLPPIFRVISSQTTIDLIGIPKISERDARLEIAITRIGIEICVGGDWGSYSPKTILMQLSRFQSQIAVRPR